MAYRQSLMKFAQKYGVSRASRKYNKGRSYIYFWLARWDGSVESLACQSKRPHSHPNQHTEAELKLIRDMRRRNPKLGMIELWHRLRKRGYSRCPESLFRVMRKMGMFPPAEKKNSYEPKPYEQMQYPGQRVQVDVKVVPRKCIADPELKLYQYTAIDEFTRLRFLAAYPEQSTYSSADFLQRLNKWYARRGIHVECVQTDNGFEFTNRFSNSKKDLPTLLRTPLCSSVSVISSSAPILPGTTARSSAATVKIRNASIAAIHSFPLRTLTSNCKSTIAAPTTFR